jgi:leucyl aminopeptidase
LLALFAPAGAASVIPIWPVAKAGLENWLAGQPANVAAWARANQFKGQAGRVLKIPAPDQEVVGACYG